MTIPGKLPGLNEYICAERANKYKAAKMKRASEDIVIFAARNCLRGVNIKKPVEMHYTWIEQSNRRDRDNIAFAKKFVQDALVSIGVLEDDDHKHVVGFTDRFQTDKNNPRIEVLIKEI